MASPLVTEPSPSASISENRKEANKKVKELTYKLQKKDIEVAKQYLKTGLALNSYKNSITAFENFISDHPGSIFREDAYFGQVNMDLMKNLMS